MALARAGAGNGERELVPSMQLPSCLLLGAGEGSQPVSKVHPALGRSSTELQLWVCSVEELQLLPLLPRFELSSPHCFAEKQQ